MIQSEREKEALSLGAVRTRVWKEAPVPLRLPNHEYAVNYSIVQEKINLFSGGPLGFIAVFGSAAQQVQTRRTTRKFLGMFPYTKDERITPPANDVDILIVYKGTGPESRLEANLPLRYSISDGYSLGWVERQEAGALHLLFVSEQKLRDVLQLGDADAIRILDGSSLIEGDQTLYEEFRRIVRAQTGGGVIL